MTLNQQNEGWRAKGRPASNDVQEEDEDEHADADDDYEYDYGYAYGYDG